ncbi:type III-A CRISPR-associated RAMP protein Csm3 [Methanocaldococcus fervens]|uniref:CRISPR system Cms endoribonuclease Csm3 n=1 Tax=Methanocaldococcus fervens (strain DSM 4213 / JCM 15782 / AG86) TaxID=573064 RepID=C7P8A5_METFA|nr:type III-A CRISPR-associated RAMP protein Csm3 [Methanocaldococcus fervens]ACV24787.1 CRISPR-associated RAMP protein, Csm3 family [Methanocaldococcus fervens AG86]
MEIKSSYTLKGKIIIEGVIEAQTGLHIGGLSDTLKIGGTDLPVIKDSYGRIFIPGSSLKGKIRSLLEKKEGKAKVKIKFYKIVKKDNKEKKEYTREIECKLNELTDDKLKLEGDEQGYEISAMPCDCGICYICKIFGPHNSKNIKEPVRIIVRDSYLVKKIDGGYKIIDKKEDKDEYYEHLEIKPENVIDRVKGTAQHPRFIERVVAGSKFKFEIVFNVYKENDKDLIEKFIEGMKLLEDDYLGGSGSRGYGKIKFEELKIINKPIDYYKGNTNALSKKEANDLDDLTVKLDEIWNY